VYLTRIKVIGGKGSKIRKELLTSLEELGYFIVDRDYEVIIVIGSISKALKVYEKLGKRKLIITVTKGGDYVIPITKENKGGAILGNIIADILNSQLVLSSQISNLGLFSIEEFCWINALKLPKNTIKINKKLVKNKKLKLFIDDSRNYFLPEGYTITKEIHDADLIISEKIMGMNILVPLQVYVGVVYEQQVNSEVLRNCIELTLRSLNITERRFDKILTKKINNGSRYVEECEKLLLSQNARILLRPTKRALGIYTCLGIK
jgi:cobalt-precorrin 5A hydrolase